MTKTCLGGRSDSITLLSWCNLMDESRGDWCGMIRAFCLIDSSNRCIFHWASNATESADWFERLRKELSAGQLPKVIKDFVRAANLGDEKARLVELEGYHLTLQIHRGFLIVADASSEDNYSKTMPMLLAEVDRAVTEDPLSLSELLSDIDTPGRSRLIGQISTILQYQERDIDAVR
jgi:hypothetical protein